MEEEREFEKCINCNKNIRVYFPVGWCHFNGIVPCFPDAEESTREYNMVATPRITKRRIGKNEKVYAFIAWDDCDDRKVVFLCKTKELAEKLMENHKKAGWENTTVQEMCVYESLEKAEGGVI